MTYYASHPVPGEYKYRDLALRVEGVSDEAVKYGYGFCATRTIECLHYKLQTCPLVREGALYQEVRKQLLNIGKLKSGHGYQRMPDTKTNWPTDRRLQIQPQRQPQPTQYPNFTCVTKFVKQE
jgi:hypothetical protein